jgi:Tfp pilus assembly protein PilO
MLRDFRIRLLFHVGTTVSLLLIMVGVFLYLHADIKEKSDAIYGSRSDLYAQAQMIENYMSLKEDSVRAESALRKLQSVLPDKDGLYEAKAAFEQMARLRGVAFNWRFGEEQAATKTEPGNVSLEIITQGGYNEVVLFLQDIENSSFFINIIGADISRQGSQTNAVITAKIFFGE